jgi:hypothetical protein
MGRQFQRELPGGNAHGISYATLLSLLKSGGAHFRPRHANFTQPKSCAGRDSDVMPAIIPNAGSVVIVGTASSLGNATARAQSKTAKKAAK